MGYSIPHHNHQSSSSGSSKRPPSLPIKSGYCVSFYMRRGSPPQGFVSCRTTTSGFSSLTRPASSSTFVAIQSQFHCMILRPLLCLAPEVTSVSGWFPSWSAAIFSTLHSPHIHVPASLASSTASLWPSTHFKWKVSQHLEHFRGVFTLLSLLPHLGHFPSGSCSTTSSSSPSSCFLSPEFTHPGQLHSPMLPLGSPCISYGLFVRTQSPRMWPLFLGAPHTPHTVSSPPPPPPSADVLPCNGGTRMGISLPPLFLWDPSTTRGQPPTPPPPAPSALQGHSIYSYGPITSSARRARVRLHITCHHQLHAGEVRWFASPDLRKNDAFQWFGGSWCFCGGFVGPIPLGSGPPRHTTWRSRHVCT